jgi:hypothetical protein
MCKNFSTALKAAVYERFVDAFPEGKWISQKEFTRVSCDVTFSDCAVFQITQEHVQQTRSYSKRKRSVSLKRKSRRAGRLCGCARC